MTTITAGMTGAQFITALNYNNSVTNHFYNVKDYGALGNNSQDDTTYIQAAINACSTAGGGIVYFPNGIYLISGALQTNIGGINYNSQLYIPDKEENEVSRTCIKLLGETPPSTIQNPFAATPAISTAGVILKSTIAGSGALPSVIASKGVVGTFGSFNHTETDIENITVMVNAFEDGAGPSMSGINLLYSGLSFIKNVSCTVDVNLLLSVNPTAHVYGLIMAPANDNMISLVDNFRASGFYCGCAAGEGVYISSIASVYNNIGFMALNNTYATVINVAALHSNVYAIAAQQDTVITAPSTARLFINYLSLEPGISGAYWPAWVAFHDVLLDVSNYLYGDFAGDIKTVAGAHGYYLERGHGGNNFLFRNSHLLSDYVWVTADRPTVPGLGTRGYNMTTNKTEVWNGSTWNDCF